MVKKHRHDLLQSLTPAVRAEILRATQRVNLEAGEDLFRAGDPGDAIYVLLTGSLGVYFPGPSGYPQLSALISPGETVGEMAVVSGDPRSATVTAIRDSKLVRLSREEFERLVESKPVIMNELNRLLVYRLQSVAKRQDALIEPKTIAILPASEKSDVKLVVNRLSSLLQKQGADFATITENEEKPGLARLNEFEANCDLVFFIGKPGNAKWNAKCARQADRILIIADGRERPYSDLAVEVLKQRSLHQLVDLILLHDESCVLPSKVTSWLNRIPVNRHFNLRDRASDWEHLVRVLTGKGIGVVLSGGGARAYAHIGALRAIHDSGLAIDFIGGTSMGAIIAACHAIGWSLDEITDRVRQTFVASNPLSDYTLPLMSLVRGHKVERLLYQNFAEANIADLWTPFFCVSTNLTNGLVHIHKKDKIWKALRASIALPGILPPVPTQYGILVDGGVLDNMPVDVMRGIHRGKVLAVDVAREHTMDTQWLEKEQARPWYRKAISPPIIPLLMRAGTVSGDAINRQQADHADLTIEPGLGEIEIRQWKCFEESIEIGYTETKRQIENNKSILTG